VSYREQLAGRRAEIVASCVGGVLVGTGRGRRAQGGRARARYLAGKRQLVEHAVKLAVAIPQFDGIDAVIDTNDGDATEVAGELRGLITD
jgi:2-C-methyl-D-erythritol 4-phosphate cytidylyltransferase